MSETRVETWVGPAQRSNFGRTPGGVSASCLLQIQEYNLPAWKLMPGHFREIKPPVLGKPKIWVPIANCQTESALPSLVIVAAKSQTVNKVVNEFKDSSMHNRLDLKIAIEMDQIK
jgi:hypothetical protein